MQETEGIPEQTHRVPSDAPAEGVAAVHSTVRLRPITDVQHSVVDGSCGPYVDRRAVELQPKETEE